jgi:hypothetical protein
LIEHYSENNIDEFLISFIISLCTEYSNQVKSITDQLYSADLIMSFDIINKYSHKYSHLDMHLKEYSNVYTEWKLISDYFHKDEIEIAQLEPIKNKALIKEWAEVRDSFSKVQDSNSSQIYYSREGLKELEKKKIYSIIHSSIE